MQAILRYQTVVSVLVLLSGIVLGQNEEITVKLQNPVTADYLKENLTKEFPKLFLTPAIEQNLQDKLHEDPLLQSYYAYLKAQAEEIQQEPLLERELQGFRLLAVSRDMVERMGVLGMIYRLEKDEAVLERIDAELRAVCTFSDWNPQHFLDVAEMSFGVALAVDWVGEFLSPETVDLARSALIEKGIKPSYDLSNPRMFWIGSRNNWNQVCHGGLIAASLVIADRDPELAARTISRALDKLPNSLKEYGPDGVYPEGPSYWGYGTSYTAIASSVLTTALDTDFGIADYPGVMESADFRLLATAPSGEFFNFADSDGRSGGTGSVLLAWFAARTGDAVYLDKPFFRQIENAGRLAGPGFVWLSQFEEKRQSQLPGEWYGRGANPVVFFRGDGPSPFYLAAKGGTASVSHGNMDAGTFIFELNGVRWIIDPGNQSYYPLNRIGFNLAGGCQECERWTLLTKKNQGHSTLTVNDARHRVKGHAPITDFQGGRRPRATIDMTAIFGDQLTSARRTFLKENDQSLLMTDEIELNDATERVTWAVMTTADVELTPDGAVLRQDGQALRLSILAPEAMKFSVLSLDPPPLAIDKRIEKLKRLEISVPAWLFSDGKGLIRVRLSNEGMKE